MSSWERRIHLIITIGGGFFGLIISLREVVAHVKTMAALADIICICFAVLYGYGVFAGFRMAERNQTDHLIFFYLIQVPLLSCPALVYRMYSGFHFSVVVFGEKPGLTFEFGSSWQFALLRHSPWQMGVNVFALVMVIVLIEHRKRSRLPAVPQTPAPPPPVPAPADKVS